MATSSNSVLYTSHTARVFNSFSSWLLGRSSSCHQPESQENMAYVILACLKTNQNLKMRIKFLLCTMMKSTSPESKYQKCRTIWNDMQHLFPLTSNRQGNSLKNRLKPHTPIQGSQDCSQIWTSFLIVFPQQPCAQQSYLVWSPQHPTVEETGMREGGRKVRREGREKRTGMGRKGAREVVIHPGIWRCSIPAHFGLFAGKYSLFVNLLRGK